MRSLIFAHRAGPAGRHPENSLAALRASLKLPLDGIEIDLQRSADGDYFVHHDSILGDGMSFEHTPSNSIRDRQLVNGEPIPRLEEFLEEMTAGTLFLDLKESCVAREVATRALTHNPAERLFFSSFHHDLIHDLAGMTAPLRLGVTVEKWPRHSEELMRWTGATVLVMPAQESQRGGLKETLAAGFQVWCWGAMDVSDKDRLNSRGVAALITDNPAALLAQPTPGSVAA